MVLNHVAWREIAAEFGLSEPDSMMYADAFEDAFTMGIDAFGDAVLAEAQRLRDECHRTGKPAPDDALAALLIREAIHKELVNVAARQALETYDGPTH